MEQPSTSRPLRADAVRNIDRIITAARECFRELGPGVPLQVIAERAGVGPATLFRNFADKDRLVLAALDQQLRLRVDPVAAEALAADDAAAGFFAVAAATIQVGSDELNLLLSVAGRRHILAGINRTLLETLGTLLERAQKQGTIRQDLTAGDVPPILAMLSGAMETNARGSEAWRRYLTLLADAIRTPADSRELPDRVPIPGFG